jgi:hypothetical protein
MKAWSAARVVSFQTDQPAAAINAYDYYLNADNTYLLAEQKLRPKAADLLRARFQYGMTLAAMAAIRESVEQDKRRPADDEESDEPPWTAEMLVSATTDTIAPILLPAIEVLGGLDEMTTETRSEGLVASEDDELGSGDEFDG